MHNASPPWGRAEASRSVGLIFFPKPFKDAIQMLWEVVEKTEKTKKNVTRENHEGAVKSLCNLGGALLI